MTIVDYDKRNHLPEFFAALRALHLTDAQLCEDRYGEDGDDECVDAAIDEADRREVVDPGPFYVNLYWIDRVYGGPEEGGWWYDAGEFVECLGVVDSKEEARALASERDDDRLPGGMRVMVQEYAGVDFPLRRPRYS